MNENKLILPFIKLKTAIEYYPEVWKAIEIYPITPGKYQISNMGRVYNNTTNRLVPHHFSKTGYASVTLTTIDGSKKSDYLLHRLVALVFIPNPENKEQVNHLGYKWMNQDLFLEWTTPAENTKHAVETGLTSKGEDRYNAVLTNNQVHTICKLLEEGYKNYGEMLEIAGADNTESNRELVGRIKRGETWKHISSEYNIPTESFGNPIVFTEEQIHQICKYLSMGYRNIEVLKLMVNDPEANTYTHKSQYDVIYKIKNKENYTQISNQYF